MDGLSWNVSATLWAELSKVILKVMELPALKEVLGTLAPLFGMYFCEFQGALNLNLKPSQVEKLMNTQTPLGEMLKLTPLQALDSVARSDLDESKIKSYAELAVIASKFVKYPEENFEDFEELIKLVASNHMFIPCDEINVSAGFDTAAV